MKTCIDCSAEKPLKSFPSSKFTVDKRNKRCRECRDNRLSKMTPQQRTRDRNLYYLYGLELEDYEQILMDQGGVCKICGETPEKDPLDVDHCHGSLHIRGLICRDCNTGLSRFKDSPDLLKRASNYLESPHNLPAIPKEIVWKN